MAGGNGAGKSEESPGATHRLRSQRLAAQAAQVVDVAPLAASFHHRRGRCPIDGWTRGLASISRACMRASKGFCVGAACWSCCSAVVARWLVLPALVHIRLPSV